MPSFAHFPLNFFLVVEPLFAVVHINITVFVLELKRKEMLTCGNLTFFPFFFFFLIYLVCHDGITRTCR